jgi:FimV-like protein
LHHFNEGERLVGRQQFDEAYPHYVDCLKVWRRSADTELRAARTARRALMYPEANSHLDRCLSLAWQDSARATAVALERMLMQVQKGELADNEEILWEKVRQDAPETPLILEALARGYTRMLRLGPAMRCLRMLLERDPDNVEALFNRGCVAEGTTGPVEALKDFRRALDLRPDRDDVRLHLSRLLVLDNPNDALRHLEQLVARKPDDLELQMELAHAYMAAGDLDKARSLMDDILERDPDNSRALSEKGALLVATDRIVEGEALLRRAIAKDRSNVDAQYQLYLCLGRQEGRETERDAQRDLHKRIEADRNRLAQILSEDMSKSPFDANLHYELGMIYYRYGKTETGLRWLMSAFKLDPTHQPTQQALADHFKRVGDAENYKKFDKGSAAGSDKKSASHP